MTINYSTILKTALPIVFFAFIQHFIQMVDAIFVGQISETHLAAVGNSGNFYLIFVLLFMGYSTGVQILIGRRNGEGQRDKIMALFCHLMVMAILFSVVIYAIILLSINQLFPLIYSSGEIVSISKEYLTSRSLGIFVGFINIGFMAYFVGITKTGVLVWVNLSVMLVNILMDYVLIFGHYGFPALGVKGAGIATVVAECTALMVFLVYVYFKPFAKVAELKGHFYNFFKPFFSIVKISWPIMAQNGISLVVWFTFFTMVEKMGEMQLAVSQIVKNIYLFSVVPVFGFHSANSTLTSNLIGANKKSQVLVLLKKSVMLCLLIIMVLIVVQYTLKEAYLNLFTSDPMVMMESSRVLDILFTVMLLFASAMVCFSIVAGSGDTIIALVIEVICGIIYLTYAYYAIFIKKFSLSEVWYGEYLYFSTLLILSLLYIRSGRWKKITI